MVSHTHMHTHTHSHTHRPWPGQSRQGQRQGSLYRCTSLLFIHVIQAAITREGWIGGWKGSRGLHGSHSTPTLLPSAHPLPLAEATPPPPPLLLLLLLTHTNRLLPSSTTAAQGPPVPAPPAWVSAKEDTWQRTERPKAAWTPSDLGRA